MGEIAEAIIEGAMCQTCGEFFEDGDVGYPRTCAACQRWDPPKPKAKCPVCGKKVRAVGLADHQRDAHGAARPSGNHDAD